MPKAGKSTTRSPPSEETTLDDSGSFDFDSKSSDESRTTKHRYRPCITYEAATWTIFLSLTMLAVVDRFTTNVWPRQTFTIGAGTAGSDRMEGFKPGPWSVVTYDVLARVSGRWSIFCFNLLLVTRYKSLEQFLPSSFVGKYLLDCSDIVNANLRLHRWNAIALCTLTLLHVWSILLPCVTHGWSAKVVPGVFEYPLSERTPPGFKDANVDTETMSLQVDDVWRMIEMTILLAILMPLSVRWLAKHYHIGMPLHRFIMILYFVDIVRRHSHPHSWVLNTPFFVLWIMDKVWSSFWRRCKSPEVYRIRLGESYMVLLWKPSKAIPSNTIGPDYFLRLHDSSLLEGAHVFTCFENRNGQPLDGHPWSAGTVIRVFDNKRIPPMGRKDPISHTKRMFDGPAPLKLSTWGPYFGEMSDHVHRALQSDHSVTLISAGSGIGYALDALQWASMNSSRAELKVLFTTRSPELWTWVRQFVASHVDNKAEHCRALLALTGGPEGRKEADVDEECSGDRRVLAMHGRISFEKEVDKGSIVFCQGGRALKNHLAKVCRENRATFYGGLGGS